MGIQWAYSQTESWRNFKCSGSNVLTSLTATLPRLFHWLSTVLSFSSCNTRLTNLSTLSAHSAMLMALRLQSWAAQAQLSSIHTKEDENPKPQKTQRLQWSRTKQKKPVQFLVTMRNVSRFYKTFFLCYNNKMLLWLIITIYQITLFL